MQGKLKVLDGSGHTTVKYDTDKDVVKEAEDILAAAAASRAIVFDATTKEKVENQPTGASEDRKILEEHAELLVVPQIQGG